MKRLILLASLLFCSIAANAQFTTTTGTIVDSDGTTWFNAKVTVQFVPNPNYPQVSQYNVNGIQLTSSTYASYLNQTVTANASGAFSLQLIDNTVIAPSGSSWKFVIQSYTSAPSSEFPNLAVSGASQSVSAFILANITAPRFSAISSQFGSSYGYGTVEVATTPIPGGSFFNVTTNQVNVWGCNASGCSWLTQAIGSFCSTTSCTFSGPLFAPQLNNVCEASLQTGADFEAQINACAAQSYMAAGGMITAYGYGNTTQYGTTQLTALSNASQPIALFLNQATNFVFNNNAGTASSACLIPINQGSYLSTPGFNDFIHGNLALGPSAVTYDFMCNANQTGTQESFQVNGAGLEGNSSATLAGSLLHLKNVFVPTQITNVSTYLPYGNAVTVDNGSDIVFDNDTIADGAPSGNYLGNVLTLNCADRVTFKNGTIQNNGIHNNLIVMNSNSTATGGCNPSGGGGYQPLGIHFYNSDIELTAATVGTITGHATNVDPIIMYDPSDVLFDGMTIFGSKGTGQTHIVDIYQGAGGYISGPVEIDNLNMLPVWAGIAVINNQYPGVAASLASVFPAENSSSAYSVGKYRWEGSQRAQSYAVDYEDNKNIANLTANVLGIPTQVTSSLPTCNSGYEGHIANITDATSVSWGTVLAGGGTNHVSVYCNGTSWLIYSALAGGVGPQPVIKTLTMCSGTTGGPTGTGCTNNASICTTSGATPNSCYLGTLNWPSAFADSNYSWTCNVLDVTTGYTPQTFLVLPVVNQNTAIATIAPTLVSLGTSAVTVSSPGYISCMGVHQ